MKFPTVLMVEKKTEEVAYCTVCGARLVRLVLSGNPPKENRGGIVCPECQVRMAKGKI